MKAEESEVNVDIKAIKEGVMQIENEKDYFDAISEEIMFNDPIVYAWFQNYRHGAPLLDCLVGTIKSLSQAKAELTKEYFTHRQQCVMPPRPKKMRSGHES